MKKITCLILSCFAALQLSAQNRPSAILVMLKAERNKISHFQQSGNTKKTELVRKDAEATMQVMINDFTDHFRYCPVYYFADTNLKYITDKNFDNILFDKDRKIYKTSPIAAADTSFFIVYYGTPPVETKEERNAEGAQTTYMGTKYPGKGLVVLGHNFKKMRKPKLLFVYEPDLGIIGPKKDPKYYFSSVNFDIGYTPLAKLLQNTIKTHD